MAGIVGGVAPLFNLSTGSQFWSERDKYPNSLLTSQDMISTRQWIDAHYPAGHSIVCWRIGALGYYTDLAITDDHCGLTDVHIAWLKHRNQLTDLVRDEYLRDRNPELVIKQGLSDTLPPAEITVGGRLFLFVHRFRRGDTNGGTSISRWMGRISGQVPAFIAKG